jgi:uncharacterized SAM-binding protein YcdF (DUF218 family)
MIVAITMVLEDLLQPLSWAFLGLLGIGISNLWNGQRRTGGIALVIGLALWGVGATPLARWLISGMEAPYLQGSRQVPTADAVVMLGGTHDYSTLTLLPFNIGEGGDRPLVALELMRLGRAPTLVLGGMGVSIGGGPAFADGEMLAVWMRGWGIPRGRLVVLGPSSNTRDEAVQVAAMARSNGWRRIIMVTSGYHLKRGEAAMRKAGVPEVHSVGAEFSGYGTTLGAGQWLFFPDAVRLRLFAHWTHEQLGWWYYRWKGWA